MASKATIGCGSLAYAAPELLCKTSPCNEHSNHLNTSKTDVYALGVTLLILAQCHMTIKARECRHCNTGTASFFVYSKWECASRRKRSDGFFMFLLNDHQQHLADFLIEELHRSLEGDDALDAIDLRDALDTLSNQKALEKDQFNEIKDKKKRLILLAIMMLQKDPDKRASLTLIRELLESENE